LQLVKKFPAFYGTQKFITSQVPATCPYPEPAQSNPYPYIPLPEDLSEYYPPIYAWVSPVVSFPQVSPPNTCPCLFPPPYEATCPVHLILLDFITHTIVGEEYRSVNHDVIAKLSSLMATQHFVSFDL
jgi:hypothetical protein